VPADAPATLFYQCEVHSVMTGQLAIVSATPATGVLTAALLAALVLAVGFVILRRRAHA
jgi:hypothetical protein